MDFLFQPPRPQTFQTHLARSNAAAALPVYVRTSSSQSLAWAGKPERVVVVFTGEHAAGLQLQGNVLYRSANVAVAEENPKSGSTQLSWLGYGLAFLCVQEPLRWSVENESPTALLTDAPQPVALRLESPHGSLQNAFFLQGASAHLELAGHESETVPLRQQQDASRFLGELEARSAGTFRARAYLDSAYGEVATFLGDLTVVVAPVDIPQQISAGIFESHAPSLVPKKKLQLDLYYRWAPSIFSSRVTILRTSCLITSTLRRGKFKKSA